MASNSGVQQQQQQQYQHQHTSPHYCKECGIYHNSAESLEVHLQYHKENLLNKWATQASSNSAPAAAPATEETNNNTPKIKREFMPNNTIAAADSSDSLLKKSPDYNSRTTPETIFGHPPTPQSYQSASSPYHDSAFSPNFANYQMGKETRGPSPAPYPYGNFNEAPPQYFMEPQQQQYSPHQDFNPMHKGYNRYHPYQAYDRPQSNPQVSSSSPAYPPQPTPSPSPKQCDKCGYVCDSASLLIEHLNMAHPPTPLMANAGFQQQQQHFLFNAGEIKTEDETQSEILDLDSHKVHQVYPEDEKRPLNGDNPHSVSALLNSWPPPQKMFHAEQQQRMFVPPALPPPHHQEFMASSTSEAPQVYRQFDQPPVISSSQVAAPTPPTASPGTKAANWKSNEARRPKTYNCTACNKWFTSSGHLKRHYNTTLHKNAVKSSGQPDPAALPISAHHHPARDNVVKEEAASSAGSPDEDTNSMPSQFERAPSGPYDRQPLMHTLHPNGSPPNGEAGPSPNSLESSGGLLTTTPSHGFMMPIENSHLHHQQQQQQQQQFPHTMYPNGSAPHVTQQQVTDTITTNNNLNITGEFDQLDANASLHQEQPLPSFAQFHARLGMASGYGDANVGGGGSATTPYSYYMNPFESSETRTLMYKTEDEEYQLTVLTAADPAPPFHEDDLNPYSPPHHNNNNVEDPLYIQESHHQQITLTPKSYLPEEAHIKRDYEEGITMITSTTVQPPKKPSSASTNSAGLVHKCIDCDKFFNKACYLTQHNKTFHCGDKPFKCPRCGKRFSSELTYHEHTSKHAGEKPHKCDLCPKQFNHKTDLRRHMCLHTGQKPYTCETCGKGFIRKDHMLKHCETHFKKTHQPNKTVR